MPTEISNPSNPNRWGVVEELFWYGYLVLFITLSFNSARIDSLAWLGFLAVFYAFLATYLMAILIGMRFHLRALANARMILIFSFSTVIWLLIQIAAPGELMERGVGVDVSQIPAWFSPDTRMSITPEKTLWLLMSELFVFSWFVLSLCLIDRRHRLKQLLSVFALVGLIHAAMGIFAYLNELHLVDVKQLDGHYQIARGWFVNRNHFAAFVSLCLVGCFGFIFKRVFQGRSTSLMSFSTGSVGLYTLCGVAIGLGIFMSQSRGAVLALLISSIGLSIATQRIHKNFKLNWPTVLCIFLVLIIGMGYFGPQLLSRLSSEGFSLGERAAQWGVTFGAIKEAPLTGYGGGSYGTVFQAFRDQTELRQVIYNQSHNQFLHVWLEQGLVGLLLWIGVLICVFKTGFASIKNSNSSLVVSASFAACLVMLAAVLQSCVDFNLQIINIRCYFFAIIAIIFASPKIRHQSTSRNSSKKGPRNSTKKVEK